MVRLVELIGLGVVALAAGVGGFKLRELFGGLENITNPLGGVGDALGGLQLPSLGSIGGSGESTPIPAIQGPIQQQVVDQAFTNVPPEQQTPFDALGAGLGGLFAGLFNQPQQNIPSAEQFPNIPTDLGNRPLDLTQLAANFQANETPVVAPIPVPETVAPAQGGGPSFIGGQIMETPLENLSLSQIIDRFGVSASQAANIQAQAQNSLGNFDFGTNTGSGIGSVVPDVDINTQLGGGNVSNPQFEGLSATEIAQRLTGGPISNF